MTLTDSIRTSVLDYIKKNTASFILLQSKKQRTLLNRLYQERVFNYVDMEKALEQAVINEARHGVEHLRKCNSYADHCCLRPEYLSYAILKGKLTKKELKVIEKHLDHESTLAEFCKSYPCENLIVRLERELRGTA